MNGPNFLTVVRFFLAVGFIIFVQQPGLWPVVTAAVFFTLAALTDYFDGHLAKKHNLVTDFGKIMDPIADKFLILSAFFIFMKMNLIPGWMFTAVAAREILVTVSRLLAMKKGRVIAAEREGKLKTVFQMTTVFLALGFLILNKIPSGPAWLHQQNFLFWEFCLIQVVMLAAVGLTLFSGAKYFWNNRF